MVVRTESLMGTTVTIETIGDDSAAALDRAFDWFAAVEQICTRFDPHSELSQLSAHPGMPVVVSSVLFEAVRFAVHVAEASGGAFDPTVGASLHRRGFNREHRSRAIVPSTIEPADDTSYRDVVVDTEARTITLRRPLLLDLGAVAKGLAVDLAARELAASEGFAIDAGGDLYLGGVNRDGQPWSIGIRHPRHAGETIGAVRVSNLAVCTSGDYERVTDQRGHHIIDPRNGTSPDEVASVTVISPSAMLADALATAALVLGKDAGLAWLEQMGVEGLIVTGGMEQVRTMGWPGE